MKISVRLIGWVEQNVPQDKREDQDSSAALLWYWAYQQAEQMQESYSAKDWAYLLLNGLQPATLDEIDEIFDNEDVEEIFGEWIEGMRQFWQLA